VSKKAKAMNFLRGFAKQSKPIKVVIAFTLISVIGITDYLTGYELAFSLFYVVPIALITWTAGKQLGLLTSLAGAIVWLGADIVSGNTYSNQFIPIWNTLIRFSFFVLITLLLSALESATERERAVARLDYLTGAINSRFFYELIQMELDRLRRYKHPFTLAYIDLDNFKSVNDQFGHPVGDEALCTIVRTAQIHLRRTDVVGRLGGDEFGILLPETNQESARVALIKLRNKLLEVMRENNWPITFSIGVISCSDCEPNTVDELMKLVDELMYSVKRESKDAIQYADYSRGSA
jgi:diguanylate cyclase (GGDEF)-like protein